VTLTDPTSSAAPSSVTDDLWLMLSESTSGDDVLDRVRQQPGRLAVWLGDLPTRLTPVQETVLWEVALRARSLLVPTRCALARVLASGVVHPASVAVVPLPSRLDTPLPWVPTIVGGTPTVVTPTCLHPSERIDTVLDALAALRRRSLEVRYHVVVDPSAHRVGRSDSTGADRSEALERWDRWQARANRLGLGSSVTWSLEADALAAMGTAQAVVLAWDDDDLVASHALIDALTLGVPVVASAFPHAVELAPTGAVTLWRPGSRRALEGALHRVLTRPLLRTAMRHAARQAARPHTPAAVRDRLSQLAVDAPRGHW